MLDKIDDIDRPIIDWVHDYERTGDYGEELKDLDDGVNGIEDEAYEDFEDNIDVFNKWKT